MDTYSQWWNMKPMDSGPSISPLADYATRMRAAMAAPQAVNPLVAAYTPPTYQTTPPHVDVNAVIAAMRGDKGPAPGAPQQAPVAALLGLPGGSEANIGGADRAVGGFPTAREFQDLAAGGKAAFAGMPGALMGALSGSGDFQTGGLTGDTVGAGGGSVGPGTGANSDPVGGQNSSNDPQGMGGYAEGGEVRDLPEVAPWMTMDKLVEAAGPNLDLIPQQIIRKKNGDIDVRATALAYNKALSDHVIGQYLRQSPESGPAKYGEYVSGAFNGGEYPKSIADALAAQQARDTTAAQPAGASMMPAYKKGGPVNKVSGPDPKGPDDGYAALDKGEYVIRKSAAKDIGKKNLDKMNKGGIDAKAEGEAMAKRISARNDRKYDKDKDGM